MSEDIKSHLLVEKKGRIAYVTLNRPEVLNALTEAHWQQLANTWRALDDDPDVWVIIITGSGERAFCTGQDLKDVAKEGPEAWRGSYSVENPPGMPNMYEMYTGTPAIAAINGFCIAGGLEIALSCDIRVAAEHAQFGLQEVRWGIIPSGGGVDRLPRAMPMCIAMEMLLTGGRIDAQEAYRTGLINRVVAGGPGDIDGGGDCGKDMPERASGRAGHQGIRPARIQPDASAGLPIRKGVQHSTGHHGRLGRRAFGLFRKAAAGVQG